MALPFDNNLTWRTTDLLRWGVGKGAKLTSSEVDENMWNILLLLANLYNNPIQPHEIAAITVEGGQMTIFLSDGYTSFGPFDLPVNAFSWRGTYAGGTEYQKMDVFRANEGLYLVLADHTAPTTFNPSLSGPGGARYALMMPFPNVYDFGLFIPGQVGLGVAASNPIFMHVPRKKILLPADFENSRGWLDDAAADDLVLTVQLNDDDVGTVTFPAYENEAVFDMDVDLTIESGDRFKLLRPDTLDSGAKNLAITFAGTVVDE